MPPLDVDECSSTQKGNLRVSPLRGLLLHGPSGCGKTLLARALAAEANLALIHVQCPQLLSRFVGDSEAGLREVFRTARSMAPSLLLLDDIDSIAKARSGLEFQLGVGVSAPITQSSGSSNAVLERLLSTLLNELDGIGQRSESSSSHLPILVVGTCSASATLDSALLRSGRLEMNICVHFPEFLDRLAILHMSALNVKLTKEAELFLPEVAKCLEKKTCSEVKDVIRKAGSIALKDFKSKIGVEELRKLISS
jgi:transitional endoplasmic reticulum ATPase